MAQNQRNCQPVNNALDLQGGFPPLDRGPPISASSTTSYPPTAPTLLNDMTTASVISQSIKSGRLRKAIRDFDSHFDPPNHFSDSPTLLRGDAVPIGSRAHADFIQPIIDTSVFPPSIAAHDHHSLHTFSGGSSVGSTTPFSSLRHRSTLTNAPVPLFPLTPNTYGYATVPSNVDPKQLLMPFGPQTLTSDSTYVGPAQISDTISKIRSNEPQMYGERGGTTLCLPGPEYQTESPDPPTPLSGWLRLQSPYRPLSGVLSPTSPSQFQIPPESPSAPSTPALLSPSSVSTLYGTPPVLGTPSLPLSIPSYSNAQHWVPLLRTQAAQAVPQSRSRAFSYAEILSRGAPSAPPFVPHPPQPISAVGPPVSARHLNQPAQLQNTHLLNQRRAPSRLCNLVPVPPEPASTMDPTVNAIPGLTSFSPHPPILATPHTQHAAGKVAYTRPEQMNPSVMMQRRRYSDAVKGKTKGPIERVKVLHHSPSRSVPPPGSRPHNASNASGDRRQRPHSHIGLPYPPSPLTNDLPLHSLPGSATGRSIPGGPPKIKFKGKRQGVDPSLRTAFDDGDPLRTLLDRILASDWCQRDEEEPIYGSQQDQACTGNDEFQCLICPKRLRLQRVLRHIRAHFDIRPFVCRDCPDCCQSKNPHRATSLEGLHEHIRAKVAGKLPCSICGGLFGGQGNLNRHMQKQHSRQ